MKDQMASTTNQEKVDEVIEGRPWWKVCLIGCAVLLAGVLIAGFFLVRSFWGDGRVQSLPSGFPSELVLFRPEEAREIYFYPGETRGKVFRFMTTPVKFIASVTGQEESLPDFVEQGQIHDVDMVSVLWTDLDATQDEVLRFYAGSLKQIGVPNPEMRKSKDGETAEMVGSTTTTNFSLVLIDDVKTDVIDTLTIIVEYPAHK